MALYLTHGSIAAAHGRQQGILALAAGSIPHRGLNTAEDSRGQRDSVQVKRVEQQGNFLDQTEPIDEESREMLSELRKAL